MEINRNFLDALGFTLVDSLWQGLVIMAVAFLGLAIMKKALARWRHNFLLVCILALPLGGLYSFGQHQKFSTGFLENATPSEHMVGNVSDLSFVNEGYSTVSQLQMETFWLVDKAHWIGLIWLLGLILVSLRGVGGVLYLKRLKSNATEVQQTQIVQLLEDLRADFGLKTAVLIKESSKVMSPVVSGYFKPIILFPLGLIQGLTTEEVEVILLHELAHIKRNDFIINIVINGLRAVYFYHPAYWWLQSQLDNEREYATDEMVMSKQSNGLLLVKALAKTQEYKMTTPSLGFAGNSKNQLLKRVNRIMKKQQKPNWISGVFTIVILSVAFVLMSQSKQQKVETADSINEVEVQDTLKAVRPAFKLPTEEELENAKLRYIDSLGNRHVYLINAQEETVDITVFPNRDGSFDLKIDTTSLALAIQEIIQTPSPIMAEYNGNGEVISIKRNGNLLKGDEFNTYKKALTQLNSYAAKTFENNDESLARLAELAGIKFEKNSSNMERLAQMAGVDFVKDSVSRALYEQMINNYNVLNVQEQTRLMAMQQRAQILKKQSEQLNAYIEKFRGGSDEESLKRYMNELAKYEEYLAELKKEERLINKENDAFLKALDSYKAGQQSEELVEYETKLKTLIEIKGNRSSAENTREAERQLKALELEINAVLSSQDKKLQEEFREKAAKIIEEDESSSNPKVYDFLDNEESQWAAQKVLSGSKDIDSKAIVRLNGKFKPKLKLTIEKISKMNIKTITIYKGNKALEKFPKNKIKGYDSVIDVRTK